MTNDPVTQTMTQAREALIRQVSRAFGQRELAAAGLVALIYLVLWIFLPKPSFWGIDNGIKYMGAVRFAETGQISVPYFGSNFDPNGLFRPITQPFAVMRNGAQVPVFSPVFMVALGVFYWLFGAVGPFILPLLGGWAMLAVAVMIWRRHRVNHDGRLFIYMVGLGTPLVFYSLTLWEHTWAAAFATASVGLLSRGRRGLERSRYFESFLSGLMLAASIALRSENLLLLFIIYAFWRWMNRRVNAAFFFSLGVALGLLLSGLIFFWQTGEWLPLHIASNIRVRAITNVTALVITRAQNLYSLLFEGFRSEVISLVGLIPLLMVAVWRGWRVERNVWGWMMAVILLIWMSWGVNLQRHLGQPGYLSNTGGLLWCVPFTVMAMRPFHGERRRFWLLIWFGSLVFILTLSLVMPTTEGVHWSPRFLSAIIPLLVLISVTRAQRWWASHPPSRPIIIALAVISVMNQAFSAQLLFRVKTENAAVSRWLATTGSEPIVTNQWWRAGDAGVLSVKKPWFLTRKYSHLMDVVRGLREKGVVRFNFIENPEFIPDETWWSVGVEPLGADYFPPDQIKSTQNRQLRRKWLRIVPFRSD